MLKRFNKSGAASISATNDGAACTSLKSEQSSDHGPTDEGRVSSPLDRSSTNTSPAPKKRKLKSKAAASKLSFGLDQDDDAEDAPGNVTAKKPKITPVPTNSSISPSADTSASERPRNRLGANKLAGFAPKALTKHALRKEAEQKETLREEFRKQQEAVKAEDIVVPFVFFEGTNTVTSRVHVRKGDTIDALLSGAQKILVKEDYKKYVHLKLDDLMLVRGGVMIPHYLTIHYFIMKGIKGPQGPLFNFTSEPRNSNNPPEDEPELEGADHDPDMTKIVDVKWYKDHKHIYPSNIWEWFDPHDPDRDYGYAQTARRDAHGNSFFS